MRVYIALINFPVALAMVSHGTRGEVAVALTLVLYSYFMIRIGAINSARYKLASDLRHLAGAQQSAVERERLHLAREVHDDFGQLLTALKISLARLEKHIPQVVETTMAAARRISKNPPQLPRIEAGKRTLANPCATMAHMP